MRKVILASVLALVAGAGLWHLLQYDSGYILIVVAGKTIEMRFAFAVLSLLLLILLVRWGWRLLSGTLGIFSGSWRAVVGRRALRTELRTQRGLLSYIEGDWQGAQRDLLKASRDLPRPLVHYLAAARSAQELGQDDKAADLLNRAEQLASGNKLAVLLTRARLLLARHQYDECLAKLHQAKTITPHHPVILDLLQQVYTARADWAALEQLLPELRRYKVLPDAALSAVEQRVYLGLLQNAGKNIRGQGDDQTALVELQQIWQRLPKASRLLPEYAVVYGRLLILAQEHDQAEILLRHGLKEHWSAPLVELYGLAAPADRQAQLHQAQRWLQGNPEDAELHLALGRICLRNELWGKARDHFQQSLRLRPTPAAYAELGRLLAHMGEHSPSTEHFRQGLLLTTHGLPELPMPR
jgi:HemY protein